MAGSDAWWEIIPAAELRSSIAVRPGDVSDCSISSSTPGLWTVTLKDSTDGQSFTKTAPYAFDESTAEWTKETPIQTGTSGASLAALANLSTVQLHKATVNGADADLAPAEALQLVEPNGNPLATASLPVGGNEFEDCAYAASCPAP